MDKLSQYDLKNDQSPTHSHTHTWLFCDDLSALPQFAGQAHVSARDWNYKSGCFDSARTAKSGKKAVTMRTFVILASLWNSYVALFVWLNLRCSQKIVQATTGSNGSVESRTPHGLKVQTCLLISLITCRQGARSVFVLRKVESLGCILVRTMWLYVQWF